MSKAVGEWVGDWPLHLILDFATDIEAEAARLEARYNPKKRGKK